MRSARIDLKKIRTVPLKNRPSKVKKEFLSRLPKKPVGFRGFWNSIPPILCGKDIKALVDTIVRAREKGKPVIFSFGAHVIKCGLSPFLIDLARRGVITAFASNGASAVHDFELALCGHTSEDVAKRLKDGSFGMTRETGEFLNSAARVAHGKRQGLGFTVGQQIEASKLPFRSQSVYASSFKLGIPFTVHVGIGTDIIYQHPQCDGASWGWASHKDFITFADSVSRLGQGGVLINFGSAVIMPEVFLKALTVARNLGYKVSGFTTANFDMIRQYRPAQNIVTRPVQGSGRGYDFTGHHEIMLPLLYSAIIDAIK
ncbi:MAG: hypothetical protein JW803_04630 [Endomicrobiales bacterium]|nr:hypothetical protein [Endomicrobiales bacterium]